MMQIHGGEGKTKDIRLDFSVNINPFGMPKAVRDAWQSLVFDSYALETYPDRSCEALRRAAAGHYQVPEDWIVCGCGASELIYKIANRYRGSRALVISPGFGEYEKALREAECEVRTVKLEKERGFAFDADFQERFFRAAEELGEYVRENSAEKRTALVFLCSPNNPAGGCIPHAMMRNMLNFCMFRGIRVIVDECFLPFVTGEEPTIGFLKERANISKNIENSVSDGRKGHFESSVDVAGAEVAADLKKGKFSEDAAVSPVILKALTKSHAIPGVRLGLAISSDTKLIRELQEAGAPWTVSGIAAKLGEAAFAGWDEEEFDHMRQQISGEREYLVRGLTGAGAKVYSVDGNFLLFSVKEGKNLFEYMCRHGILIRSCESFGLGTDFYRIAVRTREENRCFLEAFTKWMECGT